MVRIHVAVYKCSVSKGKKLGLIRVIYHINTETQRTADIMDSTTVRRYCQNKDIIFSLPTLQILNINKYYLLFRLRLFSVFSQMPVNFIRNKRINWLPLAKNSYSLQLNSWDKYYWFSYIMRLFIRLKNNDLWFKNSISFIYALKTLSIVLKSYLKIVSIVNLKQSS